MENFRRELLDLIERVGKLERVKAAPPDDTRMYEAIGDLRRVEIRVAALERSQGKPAGAGPAGAGPGANDAEVSRVLGQDKGEKHSDKK